MKRLISMLIVAIMVVATFAAAIPAAAAEGVDFVDALYFDTKPVIDGIVSEEEWGDMTVYVSQTDAANIESTKPVDNRFFLRNVAAKNGFDSENLTMTYELWLRWDENNFYVAARVYDPDGHSLKNGRKNMWDGDGMQFRVDPQGYNASAAAGPEGYNPATDGKPWSGEEADIVLGFVESAGGFTEAWENNKDVGLTSFSGGTCVASVAPAGATFSSDTASGITTYEIQIPWNYIDPTNQHQYSVLSKTNPNGGIGLEYGMSAVVYNADGTSGAAQWNAGLSWGSGIINVQQDSYTSTCAGSNSVTLSGDKVSECSGYNANFTNIPGGYVAPYVAPNFPTAIDPARLVGPLTYDDPADLDVYGDIIDGRRYKDSDGNWVVRWNEDTGDLHDSPTDTGLNDTNYLSTKAPDKNSPLLYDGKGNYTMEFDIKVTGMEHFQDGDYGCTLYNWFGGAKTYEYMCGYSFDSNKFFIRETESNKLLASAAGDFSLNEWHHWVFQYYKDNSSMRFYFDPPMTADGVVAPSATPIFEMRYRYFDMPGVDSCEVIFRRFNCQIEMDNVKFYNFVDFTGSGIVPIENDPNPTPAPQPEEKTTDVEVTVDKRDDGTFAVNVPNADAYKADNVTAVSFTVDLTKADGALKYKGIEGVADGAVDAAVNEDGTIITITVKDLSIFKDIEAGKTVLSVILEPEADSDFSADDVKGMLGVKATVTSLSKSTGDSVVLYISAALLLLAVIGTGVVIYTKKRSRIDF